MNTASRQQGFTLLEVLVALAVAAVALAGVTRLLGDASFQANQMSNRVLAHWANMNQMVKIHHQPNGTGGRQTASQQIWGQNIHTLVVPLASPVPGIQLVEIKSVGLNEKTKSKVSDVQSFHARLVSLKALEP